ncbi:hypothetical protein Nepgr_010715 [Nepenthes gracilis]|uniref:Importin N-terminal domain-containing protein n=1 Tax=Nepenthes gracilis TaxID=150966 RepID=A0AAD3SDS3_NEPGR|nr:hypothetical protein Nepgr_010715 [Nepenthes gracilis]
MAMEITEVLLNAQAVDGTVPKHAEDGLKQYEEQNLPSFLPSLAGEIANEEKPVESRKLAGFYLKNALDAEEQHRKYELVQRRLSLDVGTLSSPVHDACSTASLVIAKDHCCQAFSSTCYEKLGPYIKDIFSITAKSVREDEEPVALQELKFWRSICDGEIDTLEEYGGGFTGESDVPCFYFIKQALLALVPMLLETLLKQEENQDHDEGSWNLAMAGGTYLGLIVRDDIVPFVMPFIIEENVVKLDWSQREAATYAFGSKLEGPSPDKLTSIVNVALNFILTVLTKDPNRHVKDTTAWTIGRNFEFLHGYAMETSFVTGENCQQIVTVLLQSIKQAPSVAEKACGAMYFLAQGYEDVGSTSPSIPYIQEIVQALLTVTHREDAGESWLRTAAYETLNEVVRCSTDDTAVMLL